MRKPIALNGGVVSDDMVSHSKGTMIRRVMFKIPETGETMGFLTNLPVGIPPGVVAQLYSMRWTIEKVFDEIKNKLLEAKAWGKTPTARKMQAAFIALTYNLSQLLNEEITQEHGLVDAINKKKRASRLKKLSEFVTEHDRVLPLLRRTLQRASQLCVKFYRWLPPPFMTQARGTNLSPASKLSTSCFETDFATPLFFYAVSKFASVNEICGFFAN